MLLYVFHPVLQTGAEGNAEFLPQLAKGDQATSILAQRCALLPGLLPAM